MVATAHAAAPRSGATASAARLVQNVGLFVHRQRLAGRRGDVATLHNRDAILIRFIRKSVRFGTKQATMNTTTSATRVRVTAKCVSHGNSSIIL